MMTTTTCPWCAGSGWFIGIDDLSDIVQCPWCDAATPDADAATPDADAATPDADAATPDADR